jgi:hypothetical protein
VDGTFHVIAKSGPGTHGKGTNFSQVNNSFLSALLTPGYFTKAAPVGNKVDLGDSSIFLKTNGSLTLQEADTPAPSKAVAADLADQVWYLNSILDGNSDGGHPLELTPFLNNLPGCKGRSNLQP